MDQPCVYFSSNEHNVEKRKRGSFVIKKHTPRTGNLIVLFVQLKLRRASFISFTHFFVPFRSCFVLFQLNTRNA